MNSAPNIDWAGLAGLLGGTVGFVLVLLAATLFVLAILMPLTVYFILRETRQIRLLIQTQIEADRYRSRQLVVEHRKP